MNEIEVEIKAINLKINEIELLLDKDFEEWTLKEKQKFGNHDQLRKKEEQLLKQKTLLLQRKDSRTAGAGSQKTSFVQKEFIKTNSLIPSKLDDPQGYVIYLLEKKISYKAIILPNNATFNEKSCLEYRLDRRVTNYVPDSIDNVKLVLAVSGAGKTRMLLELLYSTYGYYFTTKSSFKDFGSSDLGECRVHCNYHPEDTERAIWLLYFIRVSVCNYLKSKEFGDPKTVLLAQIHPRAFFGSDIFEELFISLVKDPLFKASQIVDPFPLVAIDNIQVALNGYGDSGLHRLPSSNNKHLFFSPLVYYSKLMNMFPHFLLSGTGTNFDFVKELMESGTTTSYEIVSAFHSLSKSEVKSFAAQFLKDQQVAEADEIVARISDFELCHGRPCFVAFILEVYMETKDIDLTIGEFVAGITNIYGQLTPFKFLQSDLECKIQSLGRPTAADAIKRIISDGLLEVIMKGKHIFTITEEDGAVAIRYGLGFSVVKQGKLIGIEIEEQAIVECLRYYIPFADIVKTFATRLAESQKPQMVGYLIEYLVAFALVGNTSGDDTANRIGVWKGPFTNEYLCHGDSSQVCFPTHLCGPDIIYKCTKTKTVYIVQVKFVKGISKQKITNSCDTTNPEFFYCNRKSNVALKRFEANRRQLLASVSELQVNGYSLQQLLFTHTGGNTSDYTRDARIINSENSPEFFNKIGPGVWQFLDSLR